ncbi:MAG: nucleotidyltransferase family protein [Bacteroidales bacterium]|jgi:NDP-sugar pyrophosphorylase family protein|nr:nucleotidyltransferase family protein [Bacteroidales bacterium]
MKAMILAAGRGSRLKSLTENTPKALVKAGAMSLLERLIMKMKVQGVSSIVINVHHYADQIIEFIRQKENFGIPIDFSDERDMLLETGGGILKAAHFFRGDEPFIVHNVDILSDLDLRSIHHEHVKSGALATLAVKKRNTSRYLLFDKTMSMKGWENRSTGEKIIPAGDGSSLLPYAFSGIHVISPRIFPLITETGVFSIIDTYLRLCEVQQIKGYRHDEGLWIDAGKPEGLEMANMLLGGL